jgi:hypothetical protein
MKGVKIAHTVKDVKDLLVWNVMIVMDAKIVRTAPNVLSVRVVKEMNVQNVWNVKVVLHNGFFDNKMN